MSLWNMNDFANGAPKFAVYSGLGVAANASQLFDNVQVGLFKTGAALTLLGVDAREKSNASAEGPKTTHAGWVQRKVGTGYVSSVVVTNGGTGYTPGPGFITFTGGGAGSGANAAFQVNAAGSIANVTLNVSSGLAQGGGASYNVAPTANAVVAFTTPAVLSVVMGGRVGRREYITLVAAGSMSFDGTANNDDAIVGA